VEVVFVLLPVALLVAGLMLALFVWAVRSGQYDDLDTPAVRILFDEPGPPPARSATVDEDRARTAGDPADDSAAPRPRRA
jgi:cbb3-type cytochrome oxidase maturation protein